MLGESILWVFHHIGVFSGVVCYLVPEGCIFVGWVGGIHGEYIGLCVLWPVYCVADGSTGLYLYYVTRWSLYFI